MAKKIFEVIQNDGFQNVRIISQSSNETEKLRNKCLNAGIISFFNNIFQENSALQGGAIFYDSEILYSNNEFSLVGSYFINNTAYFSASLYFNNRFEIQLFEIYNNNF